MTMLDPLNTLGATKAADWRYRWRTLRADTGWQAEVQAGYADAAWRPTGACPRWTGKGDTEQAALDNAVSAAVHYWTRGSAGLHG